MRSFSDLKQPPTAADMRGFRLVVAIGGLALGAFLYFGRHRHDAGLALAAGGSVLALLSLVPGLGRWLYVGWMGLGLAMGRITGPILLGIVWLVLFVPLNMVFRLVGRDSMKRKFPSTEATFWETHAPTQNVSRYFQQF